MWNYGPNFFFSYGYSREDFFIYVFIAVCVPIVEIDFLSLWQKNRSVWNKILYNCQQFYSCLNEWMGIAPTYSWVKNSKLAFLLIFYAHLFLRF